MIIWYWAYPPVTHRLELFFQNAHFKLRGPVSPGPEVVIAAIDEKSIDELGRWPFPRNVMANLVDRLVWAGAKVIGFDVVFSSPDDSSGIRNLEKIREDLIAADRKDSRIHEILKPYFRDADHDARFANALAMSNRSVLGYFFHFTGEGLEHLSESERNSFFEDIKPSAFKGFIKSSGAIDLSSVELRSAHAVESNIPELSEAVKSSGFISFNVEPDGSIRKLPVMVRYHDKNSGEDYFFPPLSLRVLEEYLKGTLLFRVNEMGIEEIILDSAVPVVVPANERGELLVNYLGGRGTFPYFSVTDIIHERERFVPAGSLKDKIVLVGATAGGLQDLRVTPFDPVYPGVEIHATVIDNILRNGALRQPAWVSLADGCYLLLWGIVLTFIYSGIRPVYGLSAWAVVVLVQYFVSHWVFVNHRFWLTDFFPFMENVLIFSFMMVFRYVTEEKQKRFIQKVFSQYLSPRVIDQLLKDPGKLKLGGEEKELTALFTDLAGFTTFSEKLSPEELVQLLNSYFTEMTEVLIRHEGTLDRYDGDAIKAFFGAPVYFEDHARRACWVCIEMQERLRQLREEWKREGKPQLFMRVGINTGLMVVGNIGSRNRMNYGMNGDSVNLAARLEGVNKQYGTFSIISESSYSQVKEFVEVRELDSIRVVGRATPVKVYELLGKSGSLDEDMREIVSLFNEGLSCYRAKKWDAAIAEFELILKRRSDDGPSLTFLKRCRLYKENPPPPEWDGIFTLEVK
ncbi:MAG: adenylate/guanylate cyclase domain-containing protein [Nitrospinaceae bacterium]